MSANIIPYSLALGAARCGTFYAASYIGQHISYNLYKYTAITIAFDILFTAALLILLYSYKRDDTIMLYKLVVLSVIASMVIATAMITIAAISKNKSYFRPDDNLARGVRAIHEFSYIHAMLVFAAFYIFGAVMIK